MKKKYNDTYQENVQLKTKLSQMKKEIDKMDKLIKQGNKNYQKSTQNDFNNLIDEDDYSGPSLKTLWQQKRDIKSLKEEIDRVETEIKDTKHAVQTFKLAQAEAQLALLTRNLEHYRVKIQRLVEQQEKEGELVHENDKLRREEVELAKRNNVLIQERDAIKQEIQSLVEYRTLYHSRRREYEQKEKEIPKLEAEKKRLQSEIEKARVHSIGSDEKMMESLEVLRKIQNDLKAKAEKFSELKAKNKYTLKNIALSLQRSNKPFDSMEDTLKTLDQNVEKTSFQALLQKEPYDLNNAYSDNAASLFFFDSTNITVD
jgi:chromosome segregation ATPase